MKAFRTLSLLAVGLLVASAMFGQSRQAPPVIYGTNVGYCGEATYNSGLDGCLMRIGPGQYGFSNGQLPVASLIPLTPNIYLNAPAAVSLGTASSGGLIPAGTYRLGATYVTWTGGETPMSSDSGSTQATTGSASTLTVTAPSAVSDAAGYRVYASAAGGAVNSEVLQPLTTAVCAGAFQVGGGITVCPFGANAVFTSLVSTGYTGPALSGAANTAGVVNLTAGPQTAVTTVTTAQAMGTWTLAAGAMNVQGKKMRIKGYAVFSNGATTPAITLSVKIGSSITPVSIVGAANANTNSSAPLPFDIVIQTTTTGSSGADEAHGCMQDATSAAWSSGTAMVTYCDNNTAASSTYDHTAANALAINIAATAALTTVTLRDLSILSRTN